MDIPSIGEPGQLIALVSEITGQTAGRFRLAAQRAEETGRSDLGAIFSQRADEESAYLDEIRDLAGIGAARQPVPAAWMAAIEPLLSVLDPTELIYLRPYGAWAEAVREKERSFRLLSFLAAQAETPQVQDLAEGFATDQLKVAQRLRHARRTAYHRGRADAARWPNPRAIESMEDLTTVATLAERLFLDTVDQGPGSQSLKDALHAVTLAALPDVGTRKSPTGRPDDDHPTEEAKPTKVRGRSILDEALDAFAFYDAVAGQVQGPEVLEKAQALTAMAVTRIEILCDTHSPPPG